MKPGTILPLVLVAAAVLGACSPAQPQAAPTVDPNIFAQTLVAAQAQAVSTALVAQQGTQSAAASSMPEPVELPTYTPYPTYTPFPTNTVVVVPTAKPVVVQPASTNTPAGPTSTPEPQEYSCAVLSASPASGAQMAPGTDFDGSFTLRNTGTKDWVAGDFDIAFVSGEKGLIKHEYYDLPKTVKPDEKVDILLDFHTPSSAGSYKAEYKLSGGTTFCSMSVTITVK